MEYASVRQHRFATKFRILPRAWRLLVRTHSGGLMSFGLFSVLFMFSGLACSSAMASMPEKDYLEALRIAQRKVDRQAALETGQTGGALSSSWILRLYGKHYAPGDQWDVIAWSFRPPTMRMTGAPDQLRMTAQAAAFHYKVLSVNGGAHSSVTIEVTQTRNFGLTPPDPRVHRIKLTIENLTASTQKTYHFEGQPEGALVSNEIPSTMTPLELFPLNIPELSTARRENAEKVPVLPEFAQDLARKAGFSPQITRATWFHQDDFFGRPVEVLWEEGEPWPSFLRTANGIAILFRKERS